MAKRPNLVFLFSDQQSWDHLGYAGLSSVHTPNLDALADEAVRFDHCVTNCPVCTPYRSILLTGRHPLHNGPYANDIGVIPDTGTTLAQALTQSGYHTGYIGKWHLQGGLRDRPVYPEHRLGFDEVFYTNNCTVDFHPEEAFYWDEQGEKVPFGEWEMYGQTDQALDYLEGRRDSEDPFCLFVSWHAPHNHRGGVGYDAPDDALAEYDGQSVTCRDDAQPDDVTRQKHLGYQALCTSVDKCVGTILAKLEDMGVAEDTLLVYTSDHGDFVCGYDRPRHKCAPESVAVRVPLLMRMPKVLGAGRASELLIGSFDIMPTLLSLLGVAIPTTCLGQNLAPALLAGDDDAVEWQPLFMNHQPHEMWRGVYTRDYTYAVGGFRDAAHQERQDYWDVLYDNVNDVYSRQNLFTDPSLVGVRARLHALMLEGLDRFDDPFVDAETLLALTTGVPTMDENQYQAIEDMTLPQAPIEMLRCGGVQPYRPAFRG